jgi:ABC-type amino acid transport substrate-binding protein
MHGGILLTGPAVAVALLLATVSSPANDEPAGVASEPERAASSAPRGSVDAAAAELPTDENPGDLPGLGAEPPSERPLKVGVAGSPPFVFFTEGAEPSGSAVEVWAAMAQRMDRHFELLPQASVDSALDAVARRELDVAIGPISITAERAERVSFTQPFAESSLAIAAPREQTVLARIRPFLTKAFFSALAALLLVLGIVGTLMWLAERKSNTQHFPERPVQGIGNGLWFALVTMTTVGYGDRAPATPAGRFIAGAWMLVSLITVSSLTAGIATALTLSGMGPSAIAAAEELRNERVAVVAGTTSEDFAAEHGAVVLRTQDLDAAVGEVTGGRAVAVVFDRPALVHYLTEHPDVDLHLAERRYEPQGYGFAVAHDAPLRHQLDVALLSLREDGQLDRLVTDD